MQTPLTPADLDYLASLPSSELRTFLSRVAVNDDRLAARLQADVEGHRYRTNDKKEVAAFFDVAPETIKLWQQKGMPYESSGSGVRGWYDLKKCAQWLADQKAGVSLDDVERAGIDAGYREEKRKMAELQRRQLEGELVHVDQFREAIMRTLVTIRKGIENFRRAFGNDGVEMLCRVLDEAERTVFQEKQ